MRIDVPVSEVADRISILRLKEARSDSMQKVVNSRRHRMLLEEAWAAEPLPPLGGLPAWPELCAVNGLLWDVEDALRRCEREGRFDAGFVELARQVYGLNDRRAALKRAIDLATGSALVEEKSYAP